jgi:hypothetical protein
MADSLLKQRIVDDMKQAMRDQDKQRLGTIRLATAAIKQKEVDERKELSDADILAIIDKMIKQRRESIKQYEAANRKDLADVESAEIEVLQVYLPQALSQDELTQMIKEAISETGAQSMQDMGKVMNILRPKVQGRADMGAVSQTIKQLLT